MNTLSTSKQKLSLAFKIIKDTVQGFVDDNVMTSKVAPPTKEK